MALFAQSSNSTVPTNTAATKIAAQVSSNSAWAVTNEYDDSTITTTDDLKSAFSSLQSGQVQYVAADAVVGTYVANNAGMDVHMVALMQSVGGYSVGVLDGNTQLKQAVSNALSALNSNGVAAVIQKKWLGQEMDLSNIKLTDGALSSSDSESDSKDSGESDTAADKATTTDPAAAALAATTAGRNSSSTAASDSATTTTSTN